MSAQSLAADEVDDALPDLVADVADLVERESFGIWERPVVATKPWNMGTLLSATHGDEHGGVCGELLGEELRLCAGKVNRLLSHDSNDFRVDAGSWLGSGRNGARLVRSGELVEEGGGHLGSARVGNAGEDAGMHQERAGGLMA